MREDENERLTDEDFERLRAILLRGLEQADACDKIDGSPGASSDTPASAA